MPCINTYTEHCEFCIHNKKCKIYKDHLTKGGSTDA